MSIIGRIGLLRGVGVPDWLNLTIIKPQKKPPQPGGLLLRIMGGGLTRGVGSTLFSGHLLCARVS
jgi:hypothetical protein